jgi:hypothetical protein
VAWCAASAAAAPAPSHSFLLSSYCRRVFIVVVVVVVVIAIVVFVVFVMFVFFVVVLASRVHDLGFVIDEVF